MQDSLNSRQPLLTSGIVFTYDSIDYETFPEIVYALAEARFHAQEQPIRYFITSHGGYADVALALYDFMRGMGNIHTYLFGAVESAAVILFAGGTRRFISPSAAIGVHATSFNGPAAPDAKSSKLAYERATTLDDQYAAIMASISIPSKDTNWWKQALAKGVNETTFILDAATLIEYGVAEYARPEDYLITRPAHPPALPQSVPATKSVNARGGEAPNAPSAPKSNRRRLRPGNE